MVCFSRYFPGTPLPLDPPLILQSFLSFSVPVHHSKPVLLCIRTLSTLSVKVSATLKIAIFPYLRFQRFQIDMLESFL